MKFQIFFIFSLTAVLLFAGSLNVNAQDTPNVIFILVDDMAYNGINAYGGTQVQTPHIDSLAAEGIKFTHAYAMPQCSPTRAAFLSGQDAARTRVTAVVREFHDLRNAPMIQPVPVRQLPYETYTVGKMFRDQGYAASYVGKWHVDENEVTNKKKLGADEYFKRYGFIRLTKPKIEIDPKNIFSTTAATISFIEKSVAEKKPFFAYVAYNAVHSKYEAREELIEKYLKLGYPTKESSGQKFPASLLAMTEELDNGVGMILAKLKQLSVGDNTLVVLMSDNGCRELAWDHAPLRAGKGSIYEGGIRVPLIFKWPGKIKPGSVNTTPVHVVDIYPTFMEIISGAAPENHILDGLSLVPLLTSSGTLPDRPVFVHHPHYVPHYNKTPATMMRLGDYKLIHFYGDKIDEVTGELIPGESWELYNVVNDLGERNNLSTKMPEKYAAMKSELQHWLYSVDAQLPTLNPTPDAANWKKKFNKAKGSGVDE